MCHERYNGEWVQCFAGGPHGGEVILPGMIPCYWDVHALESFRDYAMAEFVLDLGAFNRTNNTQFAHWSDVVPADLPNYGCMRFCPTTINWLTASLWEYIKQEHSIFSEIWLSLVERNTSFAEAFESGPRSCNWLMSDLTNDLPAVTKQDLNILLWEVNREGGNQGALNNIKTVMDRTWIGSQYCEGLYRYTDQSITAGLRGFITGPVHTARQGNHFEGWMLDAIRWSLAQWKAARL
jgi:hypothetical protein